MNLYEIKALTAHNKIKEVKTDLDSHKSAYTSYVDSNNLKVAKVDKELNNFQKTLSQVNINQEAKQSATGYGMISLPKNAANGQVSLTLFGRTLKNELNYNRDTWAEWTKPTGIVADSSGLEITANGAWISTNVPNCKFKTSTKYGVLYNVVSSTLSNLLLLASNICNAQTSPSTAGNQKKIVTTLSNIVNNQFDVGVYNTEVVGNKIKLKDIRVFELPTGSEIENDFNTMTADQLATKYPYISGDDTKSTVGAMRLKSVSADETETSIAYVVAKDEEGNIAELRSLPNGTKDEVSLSEGIVRQKNIEKILQGSDINALDTSLTNVDLIRIAKPSNYKYYGNVPPTIGSIGLIDEVFAVYSELDSKTNINKISAKAHNFQFYYVVDKGTYTDLADAQTNFLTDYDLESLIYQLATPIEIPIEVSGTLMSYPSGTIYVENVVADAGIYTDKFSILQQDLPIKEIEKISKVDFTTGIETELDVSQCVIAEDKLSFTHSDLENGDIVFTTYFYDKEGTLGETTVTYYDSRHTVKDKTTSKFYQWNLEVDNGIPAIKLVEVI